MSTIPAPPTATAEGHGPPAVTARTLALLAAGLVACLALAAVKIDRAFGLPAHPLLIHIPVVFDPILAILSIVLALRPQLRRRYGVLWAVFALVALAGTVLAAGAGDAFLDTRPRVDKLLHDHKDAGETLRLLMFGLTAAIVAVLAVDWLVISGKGPRVLRATAFAGLLAALVVALSAASGFFTVRAGHLGAKSAWGQENGRGGGGFPGGGPPGGGFREP